MQLKSINEKFLPDLLQKEFGKEIFTQLEDSQHITVKGSADLQFPFLWLNFFWFRKKISFIW
jgi:transcription-repair coupling factor (superfamily II helicase)